MGSHLLATEPATMKAFISLALLAASYASDPYGPPAPYAPAPAYAPVPVVHAAPAYHAPAPAVHAPAYHAPAPVVHAPAYHAPAPAYHAAPTQHPIMRRLPRTTNLVMMSTAMMNMVTPMSTQEQSKGMDTMCKVSTEWSCLTAECRLWI